MSRNATGAPTSLQDVLQKLEIPQDFNNYENVKETDAIVRLELWRQQSLLHLSNLRDLVKQRDKFEREELAHLVFITSAFDGEQSFVSEEMKHLASGGSTQDFLSVLFSSLTFRRDFRAVS